MFVTLAYHPRTPATAQQNARTGPLLDAATLSYLMESTWSRGGPGLLTGGTCPIAHRLRADRHPASRIPAIRHDWNVVWDHLIYAYMIENTRAYEIIGRVMRSTPRASGSASCSANASYQWLRTTEELFYKDASPYPAVQPGQPDPTRHRGHPAQRVLPDVRDGPEPRARRRRAGIPVRQATGRQPGVRRDVRGVPARGVAGDRERQQPLAGNPTDFPAIADLALRLQNMLDGAGGAAPSTGRTCRARSSSP